MPKKETELFQNLKKISVKLANFLRIYRENWQKLPISINSCKTFSPLKNKINRTSSPLGQCLVLGPGLSMNLLTKRILAKVPRDIMASLPRLEPYELKSRGVNPNEPGVKIKKSEISFFNHLRPEIKITNFLRKMCQKIIVSVFFGSFLNERCNFIKPKFHNKQRSLGSK